MWNRVPRLARIDQRGGCISLWTEELYCLSVDGKVVEVPDLLTRNSVLIEDHFDPRSESRTYTRQALTDMGLSWLPPHSIQIGKHRTPIFVPSTPRIIDACLDQARYRIVHPWIFGLSTDRPVYHLRNFIRYLFLEHEKQQEKLLRELQQYNQADMKFHIARFKRKPLVTLSSLRLGNWDFSHFRQSNSLKNILSISSFSPRCFDTCKFCESFPVVRPIDFSFALLTPCECLHSLSLYAQILIHISSSIVLPFGQRLSLFVFVHYECL